MNLSPAIRTGLGPKRLLRSLYHGPCRADFGLRRPTGFDGVVTAAHDQRRGRCRSANRLHAQNYFLNCLLTTEIASAIGFRSDEIETENSTRKLNVGVFTQPGPKAKVGRNALWVTHDQAGDQYDSEYAISESLCGSISRNSASGR